MSRTGGIQMQEKFNPSHTIEWIAFFCLCGTTLDVGHPIVQFD
jgi:hypothetical protein